MIYWDDTETISIMQLVLDQDKIMLASGDTVLGLWGRLTEKSYSEICRLKKRQGKPFLIVISSADKLDKFIDQSLSDSIKNLIASCWPGPVTLVFKARPDLPSWMISEQKTIAIRVPDHIFLQKLLAGYDGLFSTSANISQEPIPESIEAINSDLIQHVAISCFEREQNFYPQQPSTILDCSSGKIQVLRSGAFSGQRLADLMK